MRYLLPSGTRLVGVAYNRFVFLLTTRDTNYTLKTNTLPLLHVLELKVVACTIGLTTLNGIPNCAVMTATPRSVTFFKLPIW